MAGEHRTTDIGSETATALSAASGPPPALDPIAVMRSRPYLVALVLAAVLGIPISVVAYGFLALVAKIRTTSSWICHTSFSEAMCRRGGLCPGSDLPVCLLV